MLKLKRICPGHYRSADGRVVIFREVSRQTGRADEICWSVTVDGKTLTRLEETKRDAVRRAEYKLRESEACS